MSLEDGDVVMTGTPKGVGPLIKGDHLKGKIFQQGRLLVAANWLVSD
jgi:acylpyruvate hydrolase